MSVIPYTQSAFNKIANNSIRMHNNQFANGQPMGISTGGNEFISSFINDLDVYIQTILYDVNIRTLIKNYVDHLMMKYGQYVKKDIMKHIADLDIKYVSILKQRDYIQSLMIPYLYENTMINE